MAQVAEEGLVTLAVLFVLMVPRHALQRRDEKGGDRCVEKDPHQRHIRAEENDGSRVQRG